MTFAFNEQLAGFASVEFYLLEETKNWPEVLSDDNAGTIGFDVEGEDIDGTIVEESISVNDKPKLSEDGNVWPIDIQFAYLNRSMAMEQLLEQYSNLPGIAIACLNDGTRKMYGSDKEPLYMTWDIGYGEKPEDRAAVYIKIKGEQQHRPVYYNPE